MPESNTLNNQFHLLPQISYLYNQITSPRLRAGRGLMYIKNNEQNDRCYLVNLDLPKV